MGPLITVLRDLKVPSPDSERVDRDENGSPLLDPNAVFATELGEALTHEWPTDAFACQYAPVEVNGVRIRLPGSALDPENLGVIGGAVRMVARFGDLDGPGHVATPEWREATREKLMAAGLAYYETRGGFRTVERLPDGCTLETPAEAEEWSYRYRGWIAALREVFGLDLDPKCADWTHLFRLPRVVRDGVAVSASVVGAIRVVDWDLFVDPGNAPKPEREADGVPERAFALAKALPPSVAKAGGNDALFHAACEIATVTGSDEPAILAALEVFNARCLPPWPAKTIEREARRASERRAKIESDPVTKAIARLHGTSGGVAVSERISVAENFRPILRSRDGHVTLLWESEDHGYQPIAPAVIRNRIQELPIAGLMNLSDGKRQKSISAILDDYGRTYTKTVYDFSRSRTDYDESGDGRVVIGFPPRGPTPAFDADADAWLRVLGGALYPKLEAWLASCAQRHIDRLAACLIVIGEADVGKSLLAQAVAHTWGSTPPAMGLVVERFNGDMLTCPVLVDEEAQLFGSGGLSSKRFRDIAQARSRPIEHKGKEKVLLVGAQRYIVGCNGVGDIRFRDLEGGGVIGALRDRLLVVDASERTEACKAALERLRLPGAHDVDLARVAAHVAWLGATITPAPERFIGSGGDAGVGVVLAGHADQNATILEVLQEWLDTAERREGVWFDRTDLLVDPKALTASVVGSLFGESGWTRAKVTAALAPFRSHTHIINVRLESGARCRTWALDRARLIAAGIEF